MSDSLAYFVTAAEVRDLHGTQLGSVRVGPLDQKHAQDVVHTLVGQGYRDVRIVPDDDDPDPVAGDIEPSDDGPVMGFASTQFAGSGLVVNQYGVDLSNPAAVSYAASWAIKLRGAGEP